MSADLRSLFVLRAGALSERDEYIVAVYGDIHHRGQRKGREYVKDGMLFQEHGGKDNGDAQKQGADPDSFPAGKMPALYNGKVCAQGIVHVDAGPQVGGRIDLV